jgi:hypothetical protein
MLLGGRHNEVFIRERQRIKTRRKQFNYIRLMQMYEISLNNLHTKFQLVLNYGAGFDYFCCRGVGGAGNDVGKSIIV